MSTNPSYSAEIRIRRCRSIIAGCDEAMGLAQMILPLPIVETHECPTMATDGYTIYYNPGFVNDMSDGQTMFVLLHEAEHIAGGDHLRRFDRDPMLFNMAADYVINAKLVDSDLYRKNIIEFVPGMLLHPDHGRDGSAKEAIYEILLKERQQDKPTPPPMPTPTQPVCGDGEGEGGECEGEEGEEQGEGTSGGGEGEGEGEESEPTPTPPSQPTASKQPSSDGETNSQTGQQNNQATSPSQPTGKRPAFPQGYDAPGEIWDAPPNVDIQKAAEELLERLAEAELLEKAVGNGKGGMVGKILDASFEPEPWDVLREHLRKVYSAETSWLRPNRRFVSSGHYFPSKRHDAGVLHIGLDTSGSMGKHEFDICLSNLRGICDQVGVSTLKIAYIDSEVNQNEDGEYWHEIDVRSGEEVVFHARGGGGTSFDPVFNMIEEEGYTEEIQALVYMTDGWGGISGAEPPYPVFWLTTSQTPWGHSWGEIIDVSKHLNGGRSW